MKYTQLYDAKGKKRPYLMGDDGKEYFYYRDPVSKYVIRQMSKDDVPEWYESMMVVQEKAILSPIQRAIQKALIAKQVEERLNEDSLERSFVIIDPTNKIVGELYFKETELAVATVELWVIDFKTCMQKGEKFLKMVAQMNKSERLYDAIWTMDVKNRRIKIS